jgi:hypothetical protein
MIVLRPLAGHDVSAVMVVSADGSVAAGTSRLGEGASTPVYWRSDGVPHPLADEIEAEAMGIGPGLLEYPQGAKSPFDFFGYGSKDAVSTPRLARPTSLIACLQ